MEGTKPSRGTGLVLVSHSASLAAGLAELAEQMAPDVAIRPAGGTADGRLGTGYDVVEAAVESLLAEGCSGVVVLADLGSARMTAEAVLEAADDPRLLLAPGAFVEGAVAAAVAAQSGGHPDAVARAVAATTRELADSLAAGADADAAAREGSGAVPAADHDDDAGPADPGDPDAVRMTLEVINPQGLHARPAAVLARRVAQFDASVRLGGVDAASLLSLMGLGLQQGMEVPLVATGPQAGEAAAALAAAFADGFGELA